MALIACMECGAEISDKAAACPKCGCPLAAPETDSAPDPEQVITHRGGRHLEALGTLLVLGGLLIGMIWNGGLGGAMFVVGLVIFIIGRFN